MLSCYIVSYHITVYYYITLYYTISHCNYVYSWTNDKLWCPLKFLSKPRVVFVRLVEQTRRGVLGPHAVPSCQSRRGKPLALGGLQVAPVLPGSTNMGNSPTIPMPESLPLIFWSHDFTRDTCLCEASSWVLPLQEVPCRAPLKCVNSSGKTFLNTNIMTNTGSFQLQPDHSLFQQTANSRPLLIQRYSWSRLTTTLFSSSLLFYYVV